MTASSTLLSPHRESEATSPGQARVPQVDFPAAERAVRALLVALGEDPDREGLVDTPRRVAKALAELTAGRFQDAATHLARQFQDNHDDAVILKDIELYSLCEHHFLPFIGRVHIAYLPGHGRVVGLSKLARVVDVFAKRPQMQERLTNQIADALVAHLDPRGVVVLVRAEHMCMKMRGVNKQQPQMMTYAMRGEYREDNAKRAEILALLA